MNFRETILKLLLWHKYNSNEQCNHPKIEMETYNSFDFGDGDKYETRTGKYVCTQCGHTFTGEEYLELIKKK